jgi:hypothetical protein
VLATSNLVFVPGVGFRSSSGAKLVTPVSAERDEWSVTMTGPAPAMIGTDLPPRPSPVQSSDPSGAHEITLDDPVVQLRGPWRLEMPLI